MKQIWSLLLNLLRRPRRLAEEDWTAKPANIDDYLQRVNRWDA